MLPPDSHTHTEWSWDAPDGSMERSCARAVELGLPAIAFTDHVDLTSWIRSTGDVLDPPPLDVAGYLDSVARCRDLFPGLRILSGAEIGEPHWFPEAVSSVLAMGAFDRVLGSLHSVRAGTGVDDALAAEPPDEVLREYLAEALRLAESTGPFAVLAHIDYPIRYWTGVFEPARFEDEYRAVLRALAGSGRALELNTEVPLHGEILRWWYESGGDALSFGSDAHDPATVARRFADAADLAETHGFRPTHDPTAFWTRR